VCLGDRGPAAQPAVPALAAALAAHADRDEELRFTLAYALVRVDPRAEAAVPALVVLVKDKDQFRATWAAKALRRIDPRAAAEAGVP
jgi:HEAT repeat protein